MPIVLKAMPLVTGVFIAGLDLVVVYVRVTCGGGDLVYRHFDSSNR